jgi:hypothetical protein
MLDSRPLRHAGEQAPRALVGQHPVREIDEGAVHVVVGDRRTDTVDMGEGHRGPAAGGGKGDLTQTARSAEGATLRARVSYQVPES